MLDGQGALLSICVPVFNHADRLALQLESLEPFNGLKNLIEMIFVDDASEDGAEVILNRFREAGWSVVTARQEYNAGRAAALARAIRLARGRYTLIMDADDTYVPAGLNRVLEELMRIEQSGRVGSQAIDGIVCGITKDVGGEARINAPPQGLVCSLLDLRSRSRVKGDLKEVVRTSLLRGALCPMFDEFRRVPTSLLWARISEQGCVVVCHSFAVCHKVYLPGGMTQSLSSYRRGSLPPLLDLYHTVAYATSYRSWTYRLRAVVNYHRFLAWADGGRRFMPGLFGIVGMVGYLAGLVERKKLCSRVGPPE